MPTHGYCIVWRRSVLSESIERRTSACTEAHWIPNGPWRQSRFDGIKSSAETGNLVFKIKDVLIFCLGVARPFGGVQRRTWFGDGKQQGSLGFARLGFGENRPGCKFFCCFRTNFFCLAHKPLGRVLSTRTSFWDQGDGQQIVSFRATFFLITFFL